MKILGIETSCDETAVCLIEAEGEFGPHFKFQILGNALYSQVAIHAPYGGVFPNLAKREHAKNLVPLLEQVLDQIDIVKKPIGRSFVSPGYKGPTYVQEILEREPELFEMLTDFLAKNEQPDIDAIAVTNGPGLEPALWVGVNFARALSFVWNIPVVAVNHMEGHLIMSAIEEDHLATFKFPMLALLISGGHTELVVSKNFMEYEPVGQTRDDAVGEAFDKVARMLDLPYPGGPEISRLAAEARHQDIKADFKLPRPMMHEDNFDFSFSGLKTAVRRIVEARYKGPTYVNLHRSVLCERDKMVIAREFEDAVADVLVAKTLKAVDEYGAQTVVVGGGVSANTFIRKQLAAVCAKANLAQLLVPAPELATDNALMIALAGYFHALKKDFADPTTLRANGNLKLA